MMILQRLWILGSGVSEVVFSSILTACSGKTFSLGKRFSLFVVSREGKGRQKPKERKKKLRLWEKNWATNQHKMRVLLAKSRSVPYVPKATSVQLVG
jgi:hypothetical protein